MFFLQKIDSFLKKKSVNTENVNAVNNVNTNVADTNITDAVNNVINSSEIVDSVRSFKNTDVVSTVNTKNNVANNSKGSSALHNASSASHASLKSRIIRPKNLYSPKPRSDLEIVHVVSINDSVITRGCIMILIKTRYFAFTA